MNKEQVYFEELERLKILKNELKIKNYDFRKKRKEYWKNKLYKIRRKNSVYYLKKSLKLTPHEIDLINICDKNRYKSSIKKQVLINLKMVMAKILIVRNMEVINDKRK